MDMSGKSFVSILTGVPQLEQLNNDFREAELAREAPRLMVSETQHKAMKGESFRKGSKLYDFTDIRETHFETLRKASLLDRSLGSFRLRSGKLVFFVQ
jgi:hypothetical protein